MNNELINRIVERVKGRPIVVGVVGRKGGCRKTSTAHMLAAGAAFKGKRSVLILTDNQAKPEVKRPYSIIDLTDLSKAEIVFNNIEKKKDVIDVVVIDGGANRELFDSVLSKFCDLIITPSTIDDPSLIATKEYVDKYDKCFVVVSGFSYMWGIRKSGRQQQRARTILGNERVVSEISHLENHTELTEVDRATFSRKIKSECRVLYTEVLGKFKK